MLQLSALGGQLLPRGHGEEARLNAHGLLQDEADLSGAGKRNMLKRVTLQSIRDFVCLLFLPDPLFRPDEEPLLVSDFNEALLDLGMGGDLCGCVALVPVINQLILKLCA